MHDDLQDDTLDPMEEAKDDVVADAPDTEEEEEEDAY